MPGALTAVGTEFASHVSTLPTAAAAGALAPSPRDGIANTGCPEYQCAEQLLPPPHPAQ
jgi:hypothetical protein